jgi:hypothetical protein
MRVLSIGDQIQVGRCTLVFGSPEEVEALIQAEKQSDSAGIELRHRDLGSPFPIAYPTGPPALPQKLSAMQAVELTNVLDYLRTELLWAVSQIQEPQSAHTPGAQVQVPNAVWHRLQQLPLNLSQYLKHLADPHDEPKGVDLTDSNL